MRLAPSAALAAILAPSAARWGFGGLSCDFSGLVLHQSGGQGCCRGQKRHDQRKYVHDLLLSLIFHIL